MAFSAVTLCLNGSIVINLGSCTFFKTAVTETEALSRSNHFPHFASPMRTKVCFSHPSVHPQTLTFRVVLSSMSKPHPSDFGLYVVLGPFSTFQPNVPTSLPTKPLTSWNKVSLHLICWLIWHGSSFLLRTTTKKTGRQCRVGGVLGLLLPPLRHRKSLCHLLHCSSRCKD